MNRLCSLKQLSKTTFQEYNKLLSCQFYSTKTSIKVAETEDADKDLKEYERLSNITIKKRKKLPQKPPFAKNLFLGVFDTDILAYPQLEKDELNDLEKQVEPVSNYFNRVSSCFIKQPFLPSDFVDNLKQLRLFGLQSSQLLNGRELDIIGSCKFNEAISNATSATPGLLHNEYLGIQVLLKNGNEDQQKKYLPQLINGNMSIAFCVTENDAKDLSLLNTTAIFSKEQDAWILNGRKTAVINGSTADLYIVIAQTSVIGKSGLREPQLTALVVDKKCGGITYQKNDTMGIKATSVADVMFNNTVVPKENLLGTAKGGDSIVSSILTEYRLSSGSACSTLIRKLINNLVDHCKTINMGTTSIAEADYVQETIAEMTLSLYALESATYLTASLLDFYENQDCLLESSIVKVFAAEEVTKSALNCMDVLGSIAYMNDHWCNVLLRDAFSYRYLHEPTENLKLGIALLGMQHTGRKIQGDVRKMRNPLYHAKYIFQRLWTHRKHNIDDPTLKLRLGDYLHPSSQDCSELLEYSVLRLQYATEVLLARFGPEIINQHIELKKLAECVIDIYIMTACLGRASRSYCIGLENANFEMILASTYCSYAKLRVQKKIKEVIDGPYASGYENYRTIAKRVFKYGQYFPVHPLSRNY